MVRTPRAIVALVCTMCASACDAVLDIPEPARASIDSGADDQSIADVAGEDGADVDTGPHGWIDLPHAPMGDGRWGHVAVWTGREMIIWGGDALGSSEGGAFEPKGGNWRWIAAAPIKSRALSAYAWTGKFMLVWGGSDSATVGGAYFADGAAYDPVADHWTRLPQPPSTFVARCCTEFAWSPTTNALIIYGGRQKGGVAPQDGMALRIDDDPAKAFWMPLPSSGVIDARRESPAVWTGARMVFVGGAACLSTGGACTDGGAFDPSLQVWQQIIPPAEIFDGPLYHVGIATGEGRATFWGGSQTNDTTAPLSEKGATYVDATRSWTPMAAVNGAFSKPKRELATSWYAPELDAMFVWGGIDTDDFSIATGGAYAFKTKTWSALPDDGAPTARSSATAVWTGEEAIVFGGVDDKLAPLGDGKIYRP